MKRWMIGIDEAGYGPKIGPLVIGASVWLVPEEMEPLSMLESLKPEFLSRPWQPADSFVPLGDSKAIYQNKRHLEGLCLAVRFLSGLRGSVIGSNSDWIRRLCLADALRVEAKPWYHPTWEIETWDRLQAPELVLDSARRKLERMGIEFHGFACRIIDEEEFNRMVALTGNKANALGEWSLGLLRESMRVCTTKNIANATNVIEAYCDRQGGRKRYLPMLNHAFQECSSWFNVLEEESTRSLYYGKLGNQELRVSFQVEGDRLFPTAVASMLAKLVRELLLRRLNAYWQAHVGSHLRPTAGYPVDAARFRAEIEERANALEHPTRSWWRCC